MFIPGSLISRNNVQIPFQFGSITGGQCLDVPPIVFPSEANWDYWSQATSTMEPYMKDVQFFNQFNVAWIFYWEYILLGVSSSKFSSYSLSIAISSDLQTQMVD